MRNWLFPWLLYSPSKDKQHAASYSEYNSITFITLQINPKFLEVFKTTWKVISVNLPLCASGSHVAPERDDVNVTGLVVGVVFGSAAAALLVLGGWFALKKLYLVWGYPHAFDWRIRWPTVLTSSAHVIYCNNVWIQNLMMLCCGFSGE